MVEIKTKNKHKFTSAKRMYRFVGECPRLLKKWRYRFAQTLAIKNTSMMLKNSVMILKSALSVREKTKNPAK